MHPRLILGKAPAGARPHHTIHVFDVRSRVGEPNHSLAGMDRSRVNWGQVLQVDGAELVVSRQPLVLDSSRLRQGLRDACLAPAHHLARYTSEHLRTINQTL